MGWRTDAMAVHEREYMRDVAPLKLQAVHVLGKGDDGGGEAVIRRRLQRRRLLIGVRAAATCIRTAVMWWWWWWWWLPVNGMGRA
jgi:hypothetical protein